MPQAKELFEAIMQGDGAQVEQLLAKNPEFAGARTESGISAVLLAMYYNQPEIAQRLTQSVARLNIFEAAAVGNIDRVAEILKDDPTQVNAVAVDGFQPLGLAAFFGHLNVVELLLLKGAEVNSPSRNDMKVMPLHSAVAHQHLEIARALLEQGADPNARQADDFTPLHEAAQNGQLDMVKLLLQYGADANAKSAGNVTPFGMAQQGGHREVMALLAEQGV